MTANRSLAISLHLQEAMRTDLLKNLDEDFPYDLIVSHGLENSGNKRDRMYNDENTLLTMLVTAIQDDKSLKQSVNIFKEVFELKGREIREREAAELQLEQEEASLGGTRKPGRPKLYASRIAKSKGLEVSDNTAAYAKARLRLDGALVDKVFDYSTDFKELDGAKWLGMETFITDGTYFQMQDSAQLREKYYVKKGDSAYPQGLLQGIVRQGSGQVHAFKIGTRHQSELELLKPLVKKLPRGGLLLADDLYCTYSVFCLMKEQGCHIIVPGKRKRNYTVIKQLAKGDEIVELRRPAKKPAWVTKEEWGRLPEKILMRRIAFPPAVDGQKEGVQYTTLLDEGMSSAAITMKYFTRWDIEITIREVKTLMGINFARSKTEAMVLKEITVALTAYNMIRKIISKSVNQTDFSPQSHFLQECFEVGKELLVDKKGRVYNRWSPGRRRKVDAAN